MTELPVELMGSFVLPLTTSTNYVLVRGTVNRYNAKHGSAIDPVAVAEALIAKGYNIVGILPNKPVITPTPEGLILNKEQILQVVKDNQVSMYPVLEVAIQQVMIWGQQNENLKLIVARLAHLFQNGLFSIRTETVENPRELVEQRLYERMAFFDCKYGDEPAFVAIRAAPKEDQEKMLRSVVQQVMFLFDSIDLADHLVTKEMRERWEKRGAQMREEEYQARKRKREELFADKESAEKWLFGVALGALKNTGRNIERAGEELFKSKRVPELIAHHSIDLFDFVDRQVAGLGDERARRKDMGWIESPLAVLLTAFGKPRSINDPPAAIRENPGDHMYRRLMLWFDAKYVAELPDGVYADALVKEDQYQARYREKTSDYMRRDSWGYRDDPEMDSFLADLDRDDERRNNEAMQKYEACRVAIVWWKFPTWLKWKLLRTSVREEIRAIGQKIGRFYVEDFVAHIDSRIEREKRMIKMQNALLKTVQPPDMSAYERYIKKQLADGRSLDDLFNESLNEKNSPGLTASEGAEAKIRACEKEIRHLEEVRGFVHLDFVMTPAQREAEIARRERIQEEARDRFRLPFSLFGSRW